MGALFAGGQRGHLSHVSYKMICRSLALVGKGADLIHRAARFHGGGVRNSVGKSEDQTDYLLSIYIYLKVDN